MSEGQNVTPRFKEGSAASWMCKYRSAMDALSEVLSRETASNEAKDAEIARLRAEVADLVPRVADLRETVDGLMADLSRVRAQRDRLAWAFGIEVCRFEKAMQTSDDAASARARNELATMGLRIENGEVKEIEG